LAFGATLAKSDVSLKELMATENASKIYSSLQWLDRV